MNTKEERFRIISLTAATRVCVGATRINADAVVNVAKEFERYLRGPVAAKPLSLVPSKPAVVDMANNPPPPTTGPFPPVHRDHMPSFRDDLPPRDSA